MANYYDPKAYAELPGRAKFDRSYRNSFTAKMGQLIPVVCEPVVPGDRFRCGLTYQMQLAPMLNPVYDGLEVNFEAFFVPNRIIDKRWREFWTGYNEYDQMTPVDISPLRLRISMDVGAETAPRRSANPPIGIGSLADFLGVQFAHHTLNGYPSYDDGDIYTGSPEVSALPFLAYNRIWDDWYRNERVQKASLYGYYNNTPSDTRNFTSSYIYNSVTFPGEDEFTEPVSGLAIPTRLHYRNYKKDRFTTALPEPIIGGDVRIPVNNEATFTDGAPDHPGSTDTPFVFNNSSADEFSLNSLALGTIQQLKLALKEYKYKMKDTYNGNRYNESIFAHYGIKVPDSTLQRSIYLGSGRDYVNFGEVYQTSSGDGQGENGALGDYAGRGAGNGTHYLFDESFYEPGFFFVLMSISPRSRYFQGVKRMFIRDERADYFSPEYQNIGDDFLSTSELYLDVEYLDARGQFTEDRVFGYNSRWIDLKDRYDELHGDFALTSSSMFNWNFARSFVSAPVISPELSAIRPINKPFVDLSDRNDNYYCDVAVSLDALRPILKVESF